MKRLLFLLLIPSLCSATTYYVATTGNDSTGDGSIGNPFLTPQHCALAIGTAGSAATGICNLRVGTYNGSIGGFYDQVPHGTSWASAITIQAYNNEVVTLTNTGSAGSIIGFATEAYPTPRSFYWQFIGLIVDGISNTSDQLVGGLADDYVRFQNGRVHGGAHQGIEPHGDHWDLLNMEVDHNGTIGNPTPDHGVYSPGAYLLVDGGSYHNNASYGIQVYDMGSTIVNYNIVRNARIYQNDIGNTQGGGMILSQGTNNIAFNNLIYDNGQDGLDLQGLQPFAFNNTICGNGGASVRIYSASDAAQVQNNALCEGVTLESGNPGPITNNYAATTSSFTNYAAGDFTIPATSPMRGYALNLTVSTIPFSSPVSTFGVVYPELLVDLAGVARPGVLAWDAGAYQFSTSTPATRGPSDPFPAGFQLTPSNNVWKTRVDNMPVSSSSTIWIDVINGHAGHTFHANFGSGAQGDGSYNGIPYNIVWSTATPRITVPIGTYATESDTPPVGGIPIPSNVIVENDIIGSTHTVGGDQHMLILDASSNTIYEMFVATRVVNSSSWTAAQLTIWQSTSNVMRTQGWTSADAAGLQITQGLLRYEEVSPTCNINHAIRMELALTHGPYIWPGSHDANSGGVLNPPFGMRVRMKQSVDLSVLSDTTSICIFNAIKTYGLILADNGGDWYIDGVPNTGWNNTTLHNDFITVGLPVDTMEVVDERAWIVDPNSYQARAPVPRSMTGHGKIVGHGSFK